MKVKWTFDNSLTLATLVVYVIGAGIAYRAYQVYVQQANELSKQTEIQIGISLRNQENSLYEMANKDEYLMAFFADPPSGDTFSKQDAHKCIELILSNKKFDSWETSEDLLGKLYEPKEDYNTPDKIKLRKAYDLAEHLLYLLQDTYSSYKAGIISKEDYDTWIPYVDDLGFHPLFISALYFGHSSGYIKKDFAVHIKDRLMKSKLNKQAVAILYNEMLQDDWINKLGKRGYVDDIKANKP